MGQEVLVNEQIEAGARFVNELDGVLPVEVAFWLKLADEANWYLYVASEKFTEGTIREGYERVVAVRRQMLEPSLDLFDVKLLRANDPVATAVMEIQQRYHSPTLARFFRDRYFDGVIADGLFVYPSQAGVASP